MPHGVFASLNLEDRDCWRKGGGVENERLEHLNASISRIKVIQGMMSLPFPIGSTYIYHSEINKM